MKLLLVGLLCGLFCFACGASNKYFCKFYIPGVPANKTAAGFDKIIIIENSPPNRTLSIQWKTKSLLNSTDEGQVLISVYPMTRLSNYHSFYVHKFNTVEKILYTATAIHISPKEFERIHKGFPTKEKINKVNTDPTALQHVPEKENPSWIAYAFLPDDYHKCTPLSGIGHKSKSLLMIIEADTHRGLMIFYSNFQEGFLFHGESTLTKPPTKVRCLFVLILWRIKLFIPFE